MYLCRPKTIALPAALIAAECTQTNAANSAAARGALTASATDTRTRLKQLQAQRAEGRISAAAYETRLAAIVDRIGMPNGAGAGR